MAFKPQIYPCSLEDGDETLEFFVREPSGREILTTAKQDAKKERLPIENARDLFSKYVVHEDGTPSTKEEVEDFLDMRLTAMHKMSQLIQEKIGIKELTAKND